MRAVSGDENRPLLIYSSRHDRGRKTSCKTLARKPPPASTRPHAPNKTVPRVHSGPPQGPPHQGVALDRAEPGDQLGGAPAALQGQEGKHVGLAHVLPASHQQAGAQVLQACAGRVVFNQAVFENGRGHHLLHLVCQPFSVSDHARPGRQPHRGIPACMQSPSHRAPAPGRGWGQSGGCPCTGVPRPPSTGAQRLPGCPLPRHPRSGRALRWRRYRSPSARGLEPVRVAGRKDLQPQLPLPATPTSLQAPPAGPAAARLSSHDTRTRHGQGGPRPTLAPPAPASPHHESVGLVPEPAGRGGQHLLVPGVPTSAQHALSPAQDEAHRRVAGHDVWGGRHGEQHKPTGPGPFCCAPNSFHSQFPKAT